MQQRKKSARLACLLAAVSVCLAVVGCGANFEDAEEGSAEGLGETNEALASCQGQSCDGLLPANAGCKQDMVDTGVGIPIVDGNGVTIGGIGLFRSPSCQTVWAATAFYVAGGPRAFKVCAVRRRAAENDSSCQDYNNLGSDSPMKFAGSGKIVFGRAVVGGIATRTSDFVVP